MSARRIVIAAFLLFAGFACMWVPWQAPTMLDASKDEEVIVPRPDPSGAMTNLGYGWMWVGPKILQRVYTPTDKEIASWQQLGRMKATTEAHKNFREPTETELQTAASTECLLWSARLSVPTEFYRSHTKPDFQRIALALMAGAAFAAVLYSIIPLVSRKDLGRKEQTA